VLKGTSGPRFAGLVGAKPRFGILADGVSLAATSEQTSSPTGGTVFLTLLWESHPQFARASCGMLAKFLHHWRWELRRVLDWRTSSRTHFTTRIDLSFFIIFKENRLSNKTWLLSSYLYTINPPQVRYGFFDNCYEN